MCCWGAPFLGASSLPMGGEQTSQTCSKPSGKAGCSRGSLTLSWTHGAALLCGEYGCRTALDVMLYVASPCSREGRVAGWVLVGGLCRGSCMQGLHNQIPAAVATAWVSFSRLWDWTNHFSQGAISCLESLASWIFLASWQIHLTLYRQITEGNLAVNIPP